MESASSSSAVEDPNVCLRFSLGPTNLNILRPHLDVMKEYPVVIDQRDFRFDVYGRPADVASAIAYSFLGPTTTTNADHPSQVQGKNSVVEMNRAPQQPLSTADSSPGKDLQKDDTDTQSLDTETGTIMKKVASSEPSPQEEHSADQMKPSTSFTTIPSLPETAAAEKVPQRTFVLAPNDRKTDYDLAWKRFFGTHITKGQKADNDTYEAKPWSVTILLSMPFRVAQYLTLISHGFRTYLVEEPNMEACDRQGISQERLKIVAQQAGMIVAITNVQLPSIESNQEESPIWLQVDDRKALRAVLLGISKALAQEPVRGIIQKGLGKDESILRQTWDRILDQTNTSGTMPNEKEWVMDNRTSKQESTHSLDIVGWNELLPEDRREHWDEKPIPPVQRRRPERSRHIPSKPRTLSPQRISENRRRTERSHAWNTKLTEERNRWDSEAGVERGRWGTSSAAISDPWTSATSQSSSQYYRVKRNTQTIFVNTSNPNADTILTLKQRILKALSPTRERDESLANITSPEHIRLYNYNNNRPVDLVDYMTLANSGLVDQQVIAMVFKTPAGTWEDIYIATPDASTDLDYLEDEPEEVEYRGSKGKERA
ncbi:hypothetical protein FBU30_011003 [Linnemannia zychae]|nr:hypothetical protein FBU30_011003 [Linnemannia zychae]